MQQPGDRLRAQICIAPPAHATGGRLSQRKSRQLALVVFRRTDNTSKAPFSKRFEEAVGQACESAAARQVARHMGLAASTVRAIDLRCLERWEAKRRPPPLRQMGVDEIYRGIIDTPKSKKGNRIAA